MDDAVWLATSIASIFGIAGALLNATGRMKLSFVIWGFTNATWLVLTFITHGGIFVAMMWSAYLFTTFIGLNKFWGQKLLGDKK